MQKRAVAVSAAAALLGLAAVVLGFAAVYFNQKALVGSDGLRCQYRRTPALGCGIVAALLSLAGVALVTAASGCFGCCGGATAPAATAEAWRRYVRIVCATLAWLLAAAAAAAALFLYGASRNAGGTGGFTAIRRRGGRGSGSGFDFVCDELRSGVFVRASIAAGAGIAFAIAAYVDIVQKRRRDEAAAATLGVAMPMGQPQWSQQPYPPPPVAYPAAQPPYYGGYGDKQPAGTASA